MLILKNIKKIYKKHDSARHYLLSGTVECRYWKLGNKAERNLDSYLKLEVVIQSASPFKGVNKKGGA